MSGEPFYWDSSAVLSLLVPDRHSSAAVAYRRSGGAHFIASVGIAEVYSVLARMERVRAITPEQARAARSRFENGEWRHVAVTPSRATLRELAQSWALKGADLWHLAAAITLRNERTDLRLLTFDAALAEAALGERIGAN